MKCNILLFGAQTWLDRVVACQNGSERALLMYFTEDCAMDAVRCKSFSTWARRRALSSRFRQTARFAFPVSPSRPKVHRGEPWLLNSTVREHTAYISATYSLVGVFNIPTLQILLMQVMQHARGLSAPANHRSLAVAMMSVCKPGQRGMQAAGAGCPPIDTLQEIRKEH